MCSIVNNQSNLCILHVGLWTGYFPDLNRARSVSMLCTVPSYGVFPLHSRHIRGSSCRSAPSRSVPASTHSPQFHELPELVSWCQHFMSMNAINSENILQNYGGNNVNSLNHILEFDGDDELNLLQKSQ